MVAWKIKVVTLSEGWVDTCEKILEQIQNLTSKKDKDRLELIQSMRFSLYALHRSILGWLNWVNNPDIMVSFKHEELEEMNKRLAGFIEEFVKYDMEVTEKGASKSVAAKKARHEAEEKAKRGPEDIFYI